MYWLNDDMIFMLPDHDLSKGTWMFLIKIEDSINKAPPRI